MIVAWTEQAEDDLYAILDYVKGYSPDKAVALLHEFYDSADQLERFPQMGRMVPEVGRVDIRELIVDKKFRLIYKVASEYVFVIALKHGRQNLDVGELEQKARIEE